MRSLSFQLENLLLIWKILQKHLVKNFNFSKTFLEAIFCLSGNNSKVSLSNSKMLS